MPSYIPSDKFLKNRSVEQLIHHLEQDFSRLSFPLGDNSPTRNALAEIIAYWKSWASKGENDAGRAILISCNPKDAAIQIEEMIQELEQIIKRQDDECLPVKIEPGEKSKDANPDFFIHDTSIKSLEEYISNLAFGFDLDT